MEKKPLAQPNPHSEPTRVRYGTFDQQFADVVVPNSPGPHPVVVLIHGGFWRSLFGLDLMGPLQDNLVSGGFATYNLEYRRVGDPGGGFDGTLTDVGRGLDHLTEIGDRFELDLERVAIVGHSAGGHLALWCGSRHRLPTNAPGTLPRVRPHLVVGLAAVVDLTQAANDNLGGGAIQNFLGGDPDTIADRYKLAQPVLDRARTVLIHGDNDDRVPVSQSEAYQQEATVVVVPGEDHFDVINPASNSWAAALGHIIDD